jgi:dTDP-4-dehydrorhamnose 3,5-epimerase
MRVHHTAIAGVVLIEPKVFHDDRGFFLELFNENTFAAAGLPTVFRQDNHSRSSRGVLRGLHYQLMHPQGKLVTCVRGRIFDVAVDIRRGSPTFGQWVGTDLDGDDPRYLWIPPGFAHGFCVLSPVADVVYKCTRVYHGDDDRGVAWNDPSIAVPWPVRDPSISDRDRGHAPLEASRDDLPRYDSTAV